MDAERARSRLLKLPQVVETVQWGGNLVYWVGDKSLGGKMFALMDLDQPKGLVISFAAGQDRASELLELEGFRPAPYLAKAYWVAANSWGVLRQMEWESELRAAHAYVLGRLTRKARITLGLQSPEIPARRGAGTAAPS